MKTKYFPQIICFFLLLSLTKSLDNSTLSNYKQIELKRLEGIFEPDFEAKIVKGKLTYFFKALEKGDQIILDTKYLEIFSVIDADQKNNVTFKNDESEGDEYLGVPLVIDYPYEKDQLVNLTIEYSTTTDASSAQFLTKEQTVGKTHPYFFTMSEMIVGRELLPSQDTPAVKFPFYLGIKVPKDLRGMMSGIFKKTDENLDGTKTFYYQQDIPIPNYLIALAAGNIEQKEINENISVFSEPEMIDKSYNELYDFLPTILEIAQSYMGKYEWGQYNVLVMPNSFPYSGMENPCLSFCSPCLINGDKSLVDIVAHELIHSWSGNLVTNENWRDFWLNEGITMFLQRKIIEEWKGEIYSKMDAILGLFYIEEYLDLFGPDSTFTSLRPDYGGESPDDYYSDIPYEKGFNLMYYIESLIGNETMKKFFQSYFEHFKYKSLDVFEFKDYLIKFCQDNNVTQETLNKIDWDAWIFQPGKCPIANNFTNKDSIEVDEALDKFLKEELDEDLLEKFNSWIPTAKTVFMNTLEQRDEFLTPNQHDFLTNKLGLFKGQNFLIQTNYFRLILAKTDEFYEHEKTSLINDYLNIYGALDYMTGIFGLFYKKDEVLAQETLDNLRDFYHILTIKEAEEEFEDAKNNFPILSLDLKKENECSFLSLQKELEIITDEYNDTDKIFEIENGVNLISDEGDQIELNCHLDHNKKYCKIKKSIEKSGIYYLNVSKRIQNQSFAIKTFKGKNTIKTYSKEIKIDDTKTKDFNINYILNDTQIINIIFNSEPDENVKVIYNNEKEVECNLNKDNMECKIDCNTFPYDKENPDKPKEYSLKIIDLCDKDIYSFKLNVKNSTKEETPNKNKKKGLGTVAILIIIIVGLLVIVIVSFFIYRAVHRKNNINVEEVKEKKLLSDI